MISAPGAYAQTGSWDFVYDGDKLPQTIVDQGGTDWQPRSGEANGRPVYDKIKFRTGAEIGGIWSRLDDNADDPNAPGASNWARGYLFGTNIFNKWNGRMTLVMRIKDLGANSQKSVIDITNSAGNYWTLGHVIASDTEGVAGWEFGQTNDSRNGNGLSDVRVGGFNEWVVIRIVVIDDIPGDKHSLIRGWVNGSLVYESERTDDISTGEFGEIAFRRTSGGSMQKMEIDWVRMHFGDAWAPGEGEKTPAGSFDDSKNFSSFNLSPYINGAVGMSSFGVIRTVHGALLNPIDVPLFKVDQYGVPTQFDMFNLGFDAYRDMEVVSNSRDDLTGIYTLDKYAGVHPLMITGPSTPAEGPGSAPKMDYLADMKNYNEEHPGSPAYMPYFGFDVSIPGVEDGVARDMEVAVDWRSMTNAFQGYYILDVFAGIHYVNNAEIMKLISDNADGVDKFFDLFKFKPVYKMDYDGVDDAGKTKTRLAPYFLFAGGEGFPIARDLEIMTRSVELTGAVIPDSEKRSDEAAAMGIDVNRLYQPIKIDPNRSDVSKPVYAPSAKVTDGYAILDGYGAVHAMIEDENGNPIPAPWEDPKTGNMDPSVNAPYFANPPFYAYDIAVDVEIMPNGGGFCLLTRLGEVFVVNAIGKTSADNFVKPGIEKKFVNLGFDAARDLTLVPDKSGKIVGMYVLDRFGTIHKAGDVPSLPGNVLFFPDGNAHDLEISTGVHPITGVTPVTSPD